MSIKIENAQVFGWEAAIRGARNPMNSWEKSDSWFLDGKYFNNGAIELIFSNLKGEHRPINPEDFPYENGYLHMLLGPNDHKLLMNLCKGGTEESKWRRMVHVQMDITAPLYWWKEFDTYKVGTVSDSCSTMHKIHAKEFTLYDFSHEHLFAAPERADIPDFENDASYKEEVKQYEEKVNEARKLMHEGKEFTYPDKVKSTAEREVEWHYNNGAYDADVEFNDDMEEWTWAEYALGALNSTIYALNYYREKFLETNDKKYWWQMIQLLPSSYNQKRTIDLNYEVLASQYRQRKEHKLDEWREYCECIKTLPYSEFITMEETI